MPDYDIKEWNESNIPIDNAYARQAFALQAWSKLSNYVRLHAVYSEGGIYLDTDDSPKNSENRARFELACDLFGELVIRHFEWI